MLISGQLRRVTAPCNPTVLFAAEYPAVPATTARSDKQTLEQLSNSSTASRLSPRITVPSPAPVIFTIFLEIETLLVSLKTPGWKQTLSAWAAPARAVLSWLNHCCEAS